MNERGVIKLLCTGASVLAAFVGILADYLSEKRIDKEIEEKVNEAFDKREKRS